MAADLSAEPRLPRFLLDATGAPRSESLLLALRRWNLHADQDDEEVENPDPPLPDRERSGEDGNLIEQHLEEKRMRQAKRRRDQLRRYLERTADVGDLRRDLFYLQPAGAGVGLEDYPDLAELIETEATDSPERVIEALDQVGPRQLVGSARLLASMVDDVLGPEQKQVMSGLMHAVALLGADEAREVAPAVAGALRTYWTGSGELADDQLVGALRIALTVRLVDPGLLRRILGDERLWLDPRRVAEVVPMAPELLDGNEIEGLRTAMATHMPAHYEELLAAVTPLELKQRLRLMDSGAIFTAIDDAVRGVGAEEE
jgi:hypothetical protein